MPNTFSSPGGRGSFAGALLTYMVFFGMVFAGCGRKPADAKPGDKPDPASQARIYLQQNQIDEAEIAFKKAIQIAPDDVSNYIDLSLLYLPQKNYDAAETQAKAGLKIKPDNPDLKLILAEVYNKKQDRAEAVRVLKEILEKDPKNARACYLLADLGPAGSAVDWEKHYLIRLIGLAPANIVPRLQMAEMLAETGKSDSSLFYLQEIRKMVPAFSTTAGKPYQKAVSLLQGGKTAEALPYIRQFHRLMKVTAAYAAGSNEIEISGSASGYSQFTTSQFNRTGSTTSGMNLSDFMKFTDASQSAGLLPGKAVTAAHSVLAIADYDATGDLYVYASFLPAGASASEYYLFSSKVGGFKENKAAAGIEHEGQDLDAAFADYDNDGYQDLFIITTRGVLLFKNRGDGSFARVKKDIGLGNTANARKALFADFDQDGDLDLYLAGQGTNKFFRNNGDGSFTEQAGAMGLRGDPRGTLAMDFGDWDSDGDLDIVALNEAGGIQLFNNNRHSNFADIAKTAGLQNPATAGAAVAFGDYNNDGMLDIFVAGGPDGACSLFKNTGDHFVPDAVSKVFAGPLKGMKVNDAVFLDFDNDGHQDLLVSGVPVDNSGRGLRLFHNDTLKGFSDASYLLPEKVIPTQHIVIEDFNLDGDEDIFLSGPTGIQLLRNDGGNTNHYIQVQLVGLSYGNSKNNRLGIGAQVELKTGDLYQVKTVTRPLMQFGVGMRNTGDTLNAVRIIWPNGVPQTIANPGQRENLIEAQKLKGSCPFLFTWNGEKFEFIKDMMWRSALGMPLSIQGRDTSYAFSDPSKEYLLIPGEKLRPKNGRYTIKITEELWEAVYFDKARLVAVDHPDSVNVYVDERFVRPPFPGRKLYQVSQKHLPVSAKDGNGNDLRSRIDRYDFNYVSNFSSGKYQGLAEDHDLILDLGDAARSNDSLLLYLRGWIFPTDASINTALMQSHQYSIRPPSLQVINQQGQWQTVIPDLGFPMGRDKMVIADLSGKFLTKKDRRVKISTNMQIYWDHIFFSTGNTRAPEKIHDMKMLAARLDYRGYSAVYRKGGPYGPEWLDFTSVTRGQQWRDLTGYYTRYGDVLPLLQQADDRYIIANSGDEITIDFDGQHLPPLAAGWKRDFVIYSEGWVKDGDLNTACGQTVAPLPFHRMPAYPYGKAFAYPSDKAHRQYQEKYNTRKVTTEAFRDALRVVKGESGR